MTSFTHSVYPADIPMLVTVPAPMFAHPSPPGSPKLTAEKDLFATSFHRSSTLAARRKHLRFSALPVSPSKVLPRAVMALPDDLASTPFPSPAFNQVAVVPPATDVSRRGISPARSVSGLSDGSMLSSEPEDESSDSGSDSEHLQLIPKPKGEAGRPGRGGYNVFTELCKDVDLKWDETKFGRVKRYILELVKQHRDLDTRKCYTMQNPEAIKDVERDASLVHEVLTKYANCWPLHDIIKLHLKYTSSRARREGVKTELVETKAKLRKLRSASKAKV